MTFTVAIVGRPNVGKSTLFNRLTGRKSALVDDQPGVTRDRREGAADLMGLRFTIVDTAGLEDAEEGSLAARMTEQSQLAMKMADVSLMLVDAKAGITREDEHFASLMRRSKKPVIVVINKAEGKAASTAIGDSFKLGLGEPVAISAEHGLGMLELYAALERFSKEEEDPFAEEVEDDTPPPPMQIAIIGRPNVGKSTLLNRILGEERVLTGPEAGITRDSIAIDYQFEGKPLKLIDTAGMRKKANVSEKVEKLAVGDTLHAIQYAHVVILVIDANQPLEKQDNTIAAMIETEGRAMVVAVNKWDTVPDKPKYLKAIQERLEVQLPQMKGIPLVTISAKKGEGIPKMIKECFRMYQVWNKKLGTGELNRWLEQVMDEHAPPLVSGRRIKIKYMTQKSARPPSFILFSNTDEVPEHYLRYLVNRMRVDFRMPGTPIRVAVRKNKNPYDDGQTRKIYD
ncbi:MAG: ribosome biogenesis GTPase Der [Alphaproteobacteria bacterium]|nr:ribosome biogenesis GTPase Der [Alphaproteobacteria bacterium]